MNASDAIVDKIGDMGVTSSGLPTALSNISKASNY